MNPPHSFSKFFGYSPSVVSLLDKRSYSIRGDELQQLVNPFDPALFVDQYFGSRTIHISKVGNENYIRNLFSLEDLKSALACGQLTTPSGYSVQANFQRGTAGGDDTSFGISYEQVGPLLDAGATVCVTSIHLVDNKLNRFARAIKEQLNFYGAVGINCYLSPNGAGFNTHYDSKNATSLQIEGSKKWRFASTPEIDFPRDSARIRDGQALHSRKATIREEPWEQIGKIDFASFNEVTLQPGDVLCIPAGAWHSAQAEGYSLALNLYFEPHCFFELVSKILAKSLRQYSSWRSGPPATINQQQPEEVGKYFEKRLSELCHLVSSLSADEPELWRLWNACIVGGEEPLLSTKDDGLRQEIRKSDVLCVCDDVPWRFTITHDDNTYKDKVCKQVNLHHGNSEISTTPTGAAFLQAVFNARRFRAENAISWMKTQTPNPWQEVQKALELLREYRVLTVESVDDYAPKTE